MARMIWLVLAATLLSGSNESAQNKFANYRAITAYEIRPGVLAMPRYSADGEVCEIALEKLRYSPEKIILDSSLSRGEINQVFEELVPADERGAKSKDLRRPLIAQNGRSITTITEYENVSIQIFSEDLSKPGQRDITETDIVATARWKNRACQ